MPLTADAVVGHAYGHIQVLRESPPEHRSLMADHARETSNQFVYSGYDERPKRGLGSADGECIARFPC